MWYLSKEVFSEHRFRTTGNVRSNFCSLPPALEQQKMFGEISVPFPPSFPEFKRKREYGLSLYKSALCVRKRVEQHVTTVDGSYPAREFFGVHSKSNEKLKLLHRLQKKYAKQLSKKGKEKLFAEEYVDMLYIIQAIKKLAADPKCFFDVPSIMEKTKGEMEEGKHPWERITVRTAC